MGKIDTGYLTPTPPRRVLDVISHDGTRLHVEVRGPSGAPTVVLVHGWCMSTEYWTHQYRDLADRYRVVSYDQRGHGRSGVPGTSGFDPDALPGDLAAVVLATVPPGEKAILVGHSMGAMTIVGAAGERPDLIRDRCAAVVLASTGVEELVIRSRVVPMPMIMGRAFKKVSAAVLSAKVRLRPRPDAVSRFVVRYVTMSRAATPAEVEFTSAVILGTDSKVRGVVGRMIAELDLAPHVPDLNVPTIVIVGDADRLTPPWHARSLARLLPDAVALVEVPGVGHMTPLQAPETISAAVDQLADAYLPRVDRSA